MIAGSPCLPAPFASEDAGYELADHCEWLFCSVLWRGMIADIATLAGGRRFPDSAHPRRLMIGQPAASACARNVGSGSTTTGLLTLDSKGRSFCESL
jgi:hypothetical protein